MTAYSETSSSLYSLFFNCWQSNAMTKATRRRVYLQLQKVKVRSDLEAAVIMAGAEAKGPNFKTQTGSKESKL